MGTEIAFVRSPRWAFDWQGSFVMRADGTGDVRGRSSPLGEDRFEGTAWSPDGATIACRLQLRDRRTRTSACTRLTAAGEDPPCSGSATEPTAKRSTGTRRFHRTGPRIAFDGLPNLLGQLFIGGIEGQLPSGRRHCAIAPRPRGMSVATVPDTREFNGFGDPEALAAPEHHPVVGDGIEPLVLPTAPASPSNATVSSGP